MTGPLMPKATAIWLLDNTALTFEQIAEFCGLHILEVTAIADGEADQSIMGLDPLANGQLTQEEIELSTKDPKRALKLQTTAADGELRKIKGARYTPISKRQDKPDAVSWLLRNVAHLSDTQIIGLVGTTKTTIDSIRTRSHWNIQNIRPRSPIELGLCSESQLKAAEELAAKRAQRKETLKK